MSQAGSLYQRADGYWVAAVVVSGKKIVKYGKTKREAQQRLGELLTAASTQTLSPSSKLTLRQWMDRWLDQHSDEWRPSTVRSYRQVLGPLLTEVGDTRLDRLTPLQLSMTFSKLRQGGMGTRRIQQSYVALGTCIREAVRLGLLMANPLDRVDKPKHEPADRALWTTDEARRFLQVAVESDHRYAPLFLLLIGSGLRVGEALGLTGGDIDLHQRTLTVRQAFVYAGETGSVQPPKTKAGKRTITLPAVVVERLASLPRPLNPQTPLVLTRSGTRPSQSNLRREFHRLCKAADVPEINIHGIRHVHAALLSAGGIDPHSLRRRLGHSRVSTTMDIYAYAVTPDEAAADTFDSMTG
jgi:integrase